MAAAVLADLATTDLQVDIALFRGVIANRPVGKNRDPAITNIASSMSTALNRQVTTVEVRERLDNFYDLDVLDQVQKDQEEEDEAEEAEEAAMKDDKRRTRKSRATAEEESPEEKEADSLSDLSDAEEEEVEEEGSSKRKGKKAPAKGKTKARGGSAAPATAGRRKGRKSG